MAVAYRDTQTVSGASSGTNPAALTGQLANDFLIGSWMGHPGATLSAIASGWSTLDNSVDGNTGISQYFAVKKATGSGDVFNPTWTGTAEVFVSGFSGEDTTLLYDQFTINTIANQTTFQAPNATPLMDNGAQFVMYGAGDTNHTVATPPGGSYIQAAVVSSGIAMATYYRLLGVGTAGVPITGPSLSWDSAGYGPVWTLIIEAPAGGGPGGSANLSWIRA